MGIIEECMSVIRNVINTNLDAGTSIDSLSDKDVLSIAYSYRSAPFMKEVIEECSGQSSGKEVPLKEFGSLLKVYLPSGKVHKITIRGRYRFGDGSGGSPIIDEVLEGWINKQ